MVLGDAELLARLARGQTDAEIAQSLGYSRHYVAHRLMALRRRLGLRNRTALAAYAGEQGYRESLDP